MCGELTSSVRRGSITTRRAPWRSRLFMRDAKTGVHQKTLNRLVDFIDRFKQLNFAGDAELESQLDRARRELLSRTAVEYRDSATARRRLDAGIRDLADEARRLAASDATRIVERFGQMGVRKITFAA